MATRRGSRKLALDLLYEHELTGHPIDDLIARSKSNSAMPYAETLVRGVTVNADSIDVLIKRFAREWATDRMPVLDLCLMRIATFEITHLDDVPDAVAIDEAVGLAKIYSTEDSGRFINGVLDAISSRTPAD